MTPWALVRDVAQRFQDDQADVLSGYIAYSAMLAVFPFLIFATALAGLVIGPEGAAGAAAALFDVLPDNVAATLEPVLRDVAGQRTGGIVTASGLFTIWAASNGVEAVRLALDRAYRVAEGRHIALNRLIAIGVVLGGIATFLVIAALIIFAPLGFHLLERWTGARVPLGVAPLRYFVGLGVFALFLWLLHRVLPSRSMAGLAIWPGIATSVGIWALAATGLSVYLAFAPAYTVTYGALAGVIVTLLFFYLTGMAIVLGAEVNAALAAAGGRDPNDDDDD